MVDDRDLDLLLPCFTGRHGKALTEEQAEAVLEKLQSGGTARIFLRTQTARHHFPPLRLATFRYTSVSCGSQRLLQERKSVAERRRMRCHANHAVDDGNFK